MIGNTYVDSMDRTRELVPCKESGQKLICKVYFNDTGYAGKVEVPKHMFTENPMDDRGKLTLLGRIGFVRIA